MNATDLNAATEYHAAQTPRSVYCGPREHLALNVTTVKLTSAERMAVMDWREMDSGIPGADLPVAWTGDLDAAFSRIANTDTADLRDLYRALIGRKAPKGHSAQRLAKVVWLANAAAADATARLAR